MLDAFIVDWLRRERQRQEQKRRESEQPRVELPLEVPEGPSSDSEQPEEDPEGQVIVVNL